MQVSATAQAFPVWQNGYTPEPVSQGRALNSAVFAPVSQVQEASAGTIGVPGDTSAARNANNRSSTDSTSAPLADEAGASDHVAGTSTSGRKVNGKSQDRDQGSGQQGQGQQKAGSAQPAWPDGKPLDQAQQAEVEKLESRNRDVTAHEEAHKAAGGSLAGAISYRYQRGPNGKLYAVGGDVPIRISQDPNSPQKTIAQMRQVIAAALAPVDPSAQDRAVAARATQIMLSAQRSLSAQGAPLSRRDGTEPPSTSATSQTQGRRSIPGNPASSHQGPVKLYSDVAQLGRTPALKSHTLGLQAVA